MSTILEIRNATKRFNVPEGGQVVALDNVSLTVAENEFVTLLGPSGCGKTTLLRAISGFDGLDSGDIFIDGQSMAGQAAHRRPVNTVFQKYALFPHLSVARNVSYSLDVKGIAKPEIAKRVSDMLDLVGLSDLGERQIGQLSGGQQQRVALARSLVARPKILLLDEPLSALDKHLRHKMQQELKLLQHELGISFIFVTHDQEEALVMSDRIAVLNSGRIQQVDTPEALYRRPLNEFVARFIGESNLLPGEVHSIDGGSASIKLADDVVVKQPAEGLSTGEHVHLLVRPEDLTLGGNRDHGGHVVEATINEVYFVGTDYELIVSATDMPPLKLIVRKHGSHTDVQLEAGAAIRVFVPHASLHLIKAGADQS